MGPSYFASWVVDETDQEEESDTARNEGYEKGTDGTKSTKEDEGSEGWTDYLISDLQVFGTRSQGYRNSRRMAVNGIVQQLCREDEVGFVDLWDSFVGKSEMYLVCMLVERGCSFCRGTVNCGCQWLG